jgi:PEGA domain-containing protein
VPALAPPLFAQQTSAPVQPASGSVDTKPARATIAAPMPSLVSRRPVDSRLGGEKPLTPALPGAPFVGAITLESEPAGAQVFVDGRPIGLTPLLNWEVRAGSHVVRVESQGYGRWSSAVRVVTGNTLSVVATLQPARDH